jgi:cytidylate kinase
MAILTITKQYGSGGGEIGKSVAETMGYDYIPLKRIYDEAKKAGDAVMKMAETVGDGIPGFWERNDWSFIGFAAFSESTILNYALQNNIVAMTRGGNILMKGVPHALRVLIHAPFDVRVDRIVEREEDLGREIAGMMAKKADRAMAVTIQQEYGSNWMDPSEYDLAIDSSQQNREYIVTLLKDALLERQKSYNEAAQNIVRMKALAAKVKAAIATDPNFLVPTLDVAPRGETLVVSGVVRNPDQLKRIEEKIKRMAGQIPVECSIHYRGSWPFRGI